MTSRVFILSLMALAAISGVAQAQLQVGSSKAQEMLNARMAYDDCLLGAARKVDDGKSDASTIALAIQSDCVPQTQRVIRALAELNHVDPRGDAYRSAKQVVEEQHFQNAVKAVLSVRTGRIQ